MTNAFQTTFHESTNGYKGTLYYCNYAQNAVKNWRAIDLNCLLFCSLNENRWCKKKDMTVDDNVECEMSFISFYHLSIFFHFYLMRWSVSEKMWKIRINHFRRSDYLWQYSENISKCQTTLNQHTHGMNMLK